MCYLNNSGGEIGISGRGGECRSLSADRRNIHVAEREVFRWNKTLTRESVSSFPFAERLRLSCWKPYLPSPVPVIHPGKRCSSRPLRGETCLRTKLFESGVWSQLRKSLNCDISFSLNREHLRLPAHRTLSIHFLRMHRTGIPGVFSVISVIPIRLNPGWTASDGAVRIGDSATCFAGNLRFLRNVRGRFVLREQHCRPPLPGRSKSATNSHKEKRWTNGKNNSSGWFWRIFTIPRTRCWISAGMRSLPNLSSGPCGSIVRREVKICGSRG